LEGSLGLKKTKISDIAAEIGIKIKDQEQVLFSGEEASKILEKIRERKIFVLGVDVFMEDERHNIINTEILDLSLLSNDVDCVEKSTEEARIFVDSNAGKSKLFEIVVSDRD